jgi:hypothetical protein
MKDTNTITYSSKAEMKSRRLDCEMNTPQVENFERGGAQRLESESSLKVRKIEVINGKKYKVIS